MVDCVNSSDTETPQFHLNTVSVKNGDFEQNINISELFKSINDENISKNKNC